MKTTITEIKFRNGRAIVRGGRATICYKSIKDYNRKKEKTINYD
jgi:hypothetical protein